jgi:DNA-binding response OmpR family regulator
MAKNRILVVEDDKAIADGITVNLQYSGYQFNVFDNGKAAADSLAADHSYDLALLDIMLPGLDGFELFDHMEQYNIPVIYITAKSDTLSEIKGLRGGAEDYIIKPFDVLTLLVRIEKVLERTGRMKQVLYAAELEISPLERSVRRNGEEIILKPMEFDLLVMLAKNKNIALSRERLLNGVWGVDFVGETRTVDVHIGQIRKKLGLADKIRTISKMGYRLED